MVSGYPTSQWEDVNTVLPDFQGNALGVKPMFSHFSRPMLVERWMERRMNCALKNGTQCFTHVEGV